MGETAATEGGMRRGQVSPAAKYIENLGLEMPGEKNSPTPQLTTTNREMIRRLML